MADQILLKGIRLFKKKDTQPDFVLATGVITPDDLNSFCIDNAALMTEYNGQKQLRIQLLRSKDGNPYISVDTWKPSVQTPQHGFNDSIPDDGLEKLPF